MIYTETAEFLHQDIEDYENDETVSLGNGIFCFIEKNINRKYLIIGEKRALLIDTGYCFHNPIKQIRDVTNLPLMVISTHGDPDHAMGIRWFSKAYIHSLDINRVIDSDTNCANKEKTKKHYCHEPLTDGEKLYFEPHITKQQLIPVEDNDYLDLGNRMIKIIHAPGHTFGSIVLIDEKTKSMFVGDDASYNDLWIFCEGTRVPPLKQIRQAYFNITKHKEEYDTIWGAHGKQPLHKEIIDEIVESIDDLYINNDKDEINPSRFIAWLVGSSGPAYNHFYKSVKLVYTKDQIK